MAQTNLILGIVAATVLLSGCSGSSPPTVGAAGDAAGAAPARLHREGVWLVDERQRVVLLHGVNAVWKQQPYAPPDTPEGFTAADADWLRDHGFNAVRLGSLFAGVMPKQGVVDQSYLQQIDRVVQLLATRGIWVLLDFHEDMYNELFYGEGFPAWAVYTDGMSLPFNAGFPFNDFFPAANAAYDHFWNNDYGLWDAYRAAWKAVAARWQAQPYLMGYDLFNEPWPGSPWPSCLPPLGCPAFDQHKLQPLQAYALAGIREADGEGLVFFEPQVLFNESAPTYLGASAQAPVRDANLGFSWHLYCIASGNLLCAPLDALGFRHAEAGAEQLQAASLNTEFGATDTLETIDRDTSEFDANLVGWMYWAYKNWRDPTTAGSGVQGLFADDADLATVKTAKLKLLERSYPQFTAGIPEALSFDPDSGAFSYRYTPRAAAGPTEIYLPLALHYPRGYTVTVSGAQVTSAAGAGRLLLQNLAGAAEVSVNVSAQ